MLRRGWVCIVWLLLCATPALAQTGDGSLRGTVVDESGAAMPGVTVTASGTAIMAPAVTVSESDGTYRLINLPPGEYAVTAELTGFKSFRREGILLRAGATFQVDVTLAVGAMEETVTVTVDSPMLEVSKPSNVLTIDATFQKAAPMVEGKFWSDFLLLTPGVISRPHNDASGRMNYFGNAVEHRDAVTLMEGMQAGNYNDFNINRTGLSTEAIQDTEVKTGGVDASAPMGYGLVINMQSKSGGNAFSGSGVWSFQPFGWNANNLPAGAPATREVHQYDASIGGPIRRDRIWFFGAIRYTDNASGAGRSPDQAANMKLYFPDKPLGVNTMEGYQPWAKVTTKLTETQNLAFVYQSDRLVVKPIQGDDYELVQVIASGGPMLGAKMNSVWGDSITTTLTASYNNKGGNGLDSYYEKDGPLISLHREAFPNQGVLQGSGAFLRGGSWTSSNSCDGCYDLDTSSITMIRGDLSWYKRGWIGTHDFQAGFLAMPRNVYEKQVQYLNNGFIREQRRLVNPANPSLGFVPFQRTYVVGDLNLTQSKGHDKNFGFYVQDSWKPTSRLTATVGLRVDVVRRYDVLRRLSRQSSTEIGPRAGFSYLLTADAKNVLRGTYGRYHQQLMGTRNPVPSFGGNDAQGLREEYDVNGDGVFETIVATPPVATSISSLQFDPSLHQPWFDEWTIGYRRQFPWQLALDVAAIVKVNHDQFGQYDINGIYPSGPNQPFGGFGAVDPNRGILWRLTNNTWSTTHYRALQATLTKNMTNNFQLLFNLHRQWQHLEGTWNPTDPARFIQPDAFDNDRNIWRTDGVQDQNSLATSSFLVNNPMWNPYAIRMAGTWRAPWDVMVSGSYTIVAGSWSGPIIDQLPANSPQLAAFGPSTVVSSTGVRQPNPLATRIRFAFPTRGEGQVKHPDVHTVGVRFGKRIALGGARNVEISADVFNLLNAGNFTDYTRNGANRLYSPTTYLQLSNPQTPRALQLQTIFRF